MSRRTMTPEEARAWARVAATVRPIGPTTDGFGALLPDIAREEKAPPAVNGKASARKLASKPASGSPPPRRDERRPRRRQFRPAATLDLHGYNQAEAAREVRAFLSRQQACGARRVLIITGKGRAGVSVLRRNLLLWLECDEARALVSSYKEAHPRDGGAGALYIFLRVASPVS